MLALCFRALTECDVRNDVKLRRRGEALKAEWAVCRQQGDQSCGYPRLWSPDLFDISPFCRKRALAHGIAPQELAVGSGPDPPCSCRGISTDARDRVGKSPIEAIRRPESWVSTVLESGLVLIICDGIAAPGPFRIASWWGLRLGSRFGVWGLRFETLPQTLCMHACICMHKK